MNDSYSIVKSINLHSDIVFKVKMLENQNFGKCLSQFGKGLASIKSQETRFFYFAYSFCKIRPS